MELATIIERYQEKFKTYYSGRITTQQHHALQSIRACHTDRYGEMRLHCEDCHIQLSRFHCAGMHRCREAHGCARAAIRVVTDVVPVARTTTPQFGLRDNRKNFFQSSILW